MSKQPETEAFLAKMIDDWQPQSLSTLPQPIKLGLYIRVGNSKTDAGMSALIKQQVLQDYARDTLGCNEIATYRDIGFSGVNMERPALQDAKQAIQSGAINVLLAGKASQFCRNAYEYHRLNQFARQHGAVLLTLDNIKNEDVPILRYEQVKGTYLSNPIGEFDGHTPPKDAAEWYKQLYHPYPECDVYLYSLGGKTGLLLNHEFAGAVFPQFLSVEVAAVTLSGAATTLAAAHQYYGLSVLLGEATGYKGNPECGVFIPSIPGHPKTKALVQAIAAAIQQHINHMHARRLL